jgi:CDP-paratose 2-epimerase
VRVLILGAAGFIGANCVKHFADQGHTVIAFDDLSRPGSCKNLEWLKSACKFTPVIADIRHIRDLDHVFITHGPFDLILHLAGQTAVTTSISNPRDDFQRNAVGSFNVLEAVREFNPGATVIFASTNKVYGSLPDIAVTESDTRYELTRLNRAGINEHQMLDFHSPYGCSKGCADQYFLDYARMYGLKTVVFRQSCIYGPHQLASSDQGWIAHFCISAALNRPVTIFGDGKQVRDVLFIDDLIAAYEAAHANINTISGQVFNIGGGPENTQSIRKLLATLGSITGKAIETELQPWRPGDQRVYISDISKAQQSLNWTPQISVTAGIHKLYSWVTENLPLFQ